MPNDAYLKGGAGIDAVPGDEDAIDDEGAPEDTKSMLVLTGANACGKVQRCSL